MSSTALKILALVLMFIDHVAEFIPGIPIWFHWLGRFSAPLFMFCMVWGFYYTHDRKKYLLRMYGFGIGMGLIGFVLNNVIKEPGHPISNNIFVTLLMVGVVVWLIEYRREDKKKGNRLLLYFALYQIVITVICVMADSFIALRGVSAFIGALTGSLMFNEGSFLFVFLGVLMYFYKDSKITITKAYGIFCFVYFLMTASAGFTFESLIMQNYQWMMIGALPLMLLYNGKKGKGFKYFFYVFYPVHIVVLFLIGTFCF